MGKKLMNVRNLELGVSRLHSGLHVHGLFPWIDSDLSA